MSEKALVLVSGGLDSTTCLGLAVKKYGKENVVALSVYYGQKHDKEITSAKEVTEYYDVDTIQTNDNQTSSGIMKEFIDCISKGKEPEISGESVLTAMRAVFGSLESSEKGMPVKVNQ